VSSRSGEASCELLYSIYLYLYLYLYLRQYTYVDFTAHDWLDRLLYALPLRGMDQRERDNDAARAPTQPTLDFEDADEPDPHNLPGCCCCRRRRRWQLLP